MDAGRVKAEQGSLILCFSYYDFHALLDIEPKCGTYIYSSSELSMKRCYLITKRYVTG